MKKLFAFLSSKTLFANLILAVLFLLISFIALRSWLSHTTHHGQQIPVPDLSGYSLAEAGAMLETQNLRFRIIDSSEYNPDLPLGSVVAQYPDQESNVKENREILLTINPFTVRKIDLPNVIEKTLRRAVYDLESKGFSVGELVYEPDIAKDVVLRMQFEGEDIEPGTKHLKGTTIDLIVGMGLSKERVGVPYLKWLSLEEAEIKIKSNSLNIGLVSYDEDVIDTAFALVYKQSPAPTQKPRLRMGNFVDLWMTNDSTKIPNDSLQFKYPDMDLDSIRTYLETDTTILN